MAKSKRKDKHKSVLNTIPTQQGRIATNPTVETIYLREGKEKFIAKKILILCEGETEENYFEGLISTYKFKSQEFVPTVVCPPTQSTKNQPINLLCTVYELLKKTKQKFKNEEFETYYSEIEERQRQQNPNRQEVFLYDSQTINNIRSQISNGIKPIFDEIWLVFDDDDRTANSTNLNQIFHFAQLGIKIAFSNRQWENWILLHFEKTLHTTNHSDCHLYCLMTCHLEADPNLNCIIGYLQGRNYHPSYRKGHWKYTTRKQQTNEYCFEGLFEIDFIRNSTHKMADEVIVYDKIQNAVENAQWLKAEKREYHAINSTNPYTDVDRLISRLIGNEKNYIWGTSSNITFEYLSLSNLSFDRRTSKLLITIENNHESQYHLVNENTLYEFCLIGILPNFKREKYHAIRINANRALSSSRESFEIDFEPINPNIMTLCFMYQYHQINPNILLVTDL